MEQVLTTEKTDHVKDVKVENGPEKDGDIEVPVQVHHHLVAAAVIE